MYVKYSPVCNTNPELYDRYLRLVDKLSNGPSVCVGTGFGGGSGNFSGVVSGSRLLLGPVTVGSGQGTGNGETTSSETSAGTVGENRQSEDSSVRNDGFYGVSAGGVKVGPNYARNQLWREKKKAMKARRRGVVDSNVPEWRRKCERNPQTQEALEKMWISKNKVATLKYEAEAKRLEASAVNSRPFKFVERKPKTQEELDLEAAERIKKLKQRIEKHDADIAYWKKRQDSGAIDKAIALENEILDGQLSGKYDPFASRRMLGWAKTVKTHGSGTGSGSGSSGSLDKTVWSGSGATTKTDLSVLEQKVAVYEEKLKKAEKEVVDVNKKADALNKQLITVTVESERKDKELFEVKKFKEYLEKAKKEKKRRADNEFEAFRTQADCSY